MKHAGARLDRSSYQNDQDRLEAMGRVLSGVAHDFNNLLTTMIGTSEAALAQPGLDEQCADILRCLHEDAQRGAQMMRQILTPHPQPAATPRKIVALDAAIRYAAPLLRRVLSVTAGAPIILKMDLRCSGARVMLDASGIERILTNLATNARHAMKDGGTLTIRTRLIKTPHGKQVRISVRDTGAGIAHDMLPRIFERFFTTHPDTGGTGIGLASVHDIVHQAHGTISVHSGLGEGTDFRVRLPCRVPDMAKRLLFVDDSGMLRQLAGARFQASGWIVDMAADVEEALAMADRAMPSLLITDQSLPDKPGMELARLLNRRDPTLPIVVISGFKVAIGKGLQNAVRFLPKPFCFDALEALSNELV